ncbi:MAG TPA: LysR family transcriptional regulator, partial [Clostridia bacterium]|nr:LysR family transcriptional regulator [Clostridia bacterium]
MTLQKLRYVIEIVECGSVSEAAKRLFISQPSLSGAVREMEEQIGFEIFLRTNKGVVLS